MNNVIVTTQKDFDAIPKNYDGVITIQNAKEVIVIGGTFCANVEARDNANVEAYGNVNVKALGNVNVKAWGNVNVEARDNANVEAHGNANVKAWGNVNVKARDNANVEAYGNVNVEARDNANVKAWGNANVEARGNVNVEVLDNVNVKAWGNVNVKALSNVNVEARDNVNVEARDNANVEAWDNVNVRVFSELAKISLYGFSVAFVKSNLKLNFPIKKLSTSAHIQRYKEQGFFNREGIKKEKHIILYKRVSNDFKTQEGTKNETLWMVGSTVTHGSYNPTHSECGEGKFHACSRPYFCNEFRCEPNDRYIAIKVSVDKKVNGFKNLFEWKNPEFPHKVAFGEGTVLFECDNFGLQK